MRPLALVESPLQVLGLIDAVAANDLVAPRVIARSAPAAATLARLRAATGPSRHEARAVLPWACRPTGVVLGDPFSGLGQLALLATPRSTPVLLLDDGTATLRLVDALLERGTLTRATDRPPAGRRHLASAALGRLRARAVHGTLTLRTCVPLSDDDVAALTRTGLTLVQHRLEHVRALDVPDVVDEDVVVLGSALADDGLVDRARYDSWADEVVREAVMRGRTVRYLPHRREPRSRLERLTQAGARTAPSPWPAELALGGLGPGRRVVTLPTSVLLTLGGALADAGVVVDVYDVPDTWWTRRASPAARAHLRAPARLHAAVFRPTGGQS